MARLLTFDVNKVAEERYMSFRTVLFRTLAFSGILSMASILTACGGGGNDSTSATLATGKFVDAPVEGLHYVSGEKSGYTNANGEFTYEIGKNVTFSIGGITFTTAGASIVTPLAVFDTENFDDSRVVNLARLLQTLDSDGSSTNGVITIDALAHTAAASLSTIDFSSPVFDADVSTLVANGGGSLTLVSAADAKAHMQEQLSIVGTWYAGDLNLPNNLVVMTFFENGTFVFAQDGDAGRNGAGGWDGMERGTYTWNALTGAFTATPIIDTNGDWGLSSPQGTVTITVVGNTLTFTDSVEGSVSAARVTNTSGSIVGSWVAGSTSTIGDLVVFTYFDNGTYMFLQDGTPALHGSGGTDGIERGTYAWNPATGAFTSSRVYGTDTNGDWGLSNPQGTVTVTVTGDSLTYTDSVEGSSTAARILP